MILSDRRQRRVPRDTPFALEGRGDWSDAPPTEAAATTAPETASTTSALMR